MEEHSRVGSSYFSRLKSQFTDPRTLFIIALALTLGTAGAIVGSRLYLKPIRKVADTRFRSYQCLMRLYDLQLAHRGVHGTFANDLDTLLASAPDGAQLRENLSVSVDLNTLAVLGDTSRFRLEANALDPERTSIKIRGPLGKR